MRGLRTVRIWGVLGLLLALGLAGGFLLGAFAAKQDIAQVLQPASVAPPALKCYQIIAPRIDRPTTVMDQFGTERARVLKPELLCTPAIKVEPGTAPPPVPAEPHYKCYQIFPPTLLLRKVDLDGQFGYERNVEIVKSELLCVSVKKVMVTASEQE